MEDRAVREAAIELADELTAFVERHKDATVDPSDAVRDIENEAKRQREWNRAKQALVEQNQAVVEAFEQDYASEVRSLTNEFEARDMDVDELRRYTDRPTNAMGIEAVATALRALAEDV